MVLQLTTFEMFFICNSGDTYESKGNSINIKSKQNCERKFLEHMQDVYAIPSKNQFRDEIQTGRDFRKFY